MFLVRYRFCPETSDTLDPFRFRTRLLLLAACLARDAWERHWCEGLGGTYMSVALAAVSPSMA